MQSGHLEEARRLLPQLASLALELAGTHCADCRWYHGYWPYFRLLGLATGAELHAPFFHAAVARWRRARPVTRVLISGCADHALTALVLDALAATNSAQVDLHVLDRCRTPLELAAHFATHCRRPLKTHHGDVLTMDLRGEFDLIVAHSFLGYFDAQARRTLFTRWAATLAPGGHLILVQRLRPHDGGGAVHFSATQSDAFAEAVATAAARMAGTLGIEPGALVTAARLYSAKKTTWPVSAAGDLEELVCGAGLALLGLQVAPIATNAATGTAGGPSLRSADNYAHLVATKGLGNADGPIF